MYFMTISRWHRRSGAFTVSGYALTGFEIRTFYFSLSFFWSFTCRLLCKMPSTNEIRFIFLSIINTDKQMFNIQIHTKMLIFNFQPISKKPNDKYPSYSSLENTFSVIQKMCIDVFQKFHRIGLSLYWIQIKETKFLIYSAYS